MKIQIKRRYTDDVIFECEAASVKLAVVKAIDDEANLHWADLRGADLREASLRGADLSEADLREASLHWADLSGAKEDVFAVLNVAPQEASGLLQALRDGRIDGSVYSGECACLVGTIANIRHCTVDDLPDALRPNSSRPAERWFLAISQGDTPENHPIAKITAEWIEEWQAAHGVQAVRA